MTPLLSYRERLPAATATLTLETSRQSCKIVVDRILFRHRASGRALRRLALRCRLALRLVTRLIAIVLLLAGLAPGLDLAILPPPAARYRRVRQEDRRAGKCGACACRSWWSAYH